MSKRKMMAQQQTNWPFIINVGNSIIGVTILAMPFCFQKCGIILGSLMLFFSTWLTIKSCQLLVKAGIASRRRSFSLLAYFTNGATGKLIVELCMIGLQLGTLVAQVVIIGDLGPAIVSKATGFENTSNLRTSLIVCLCLFVGFPLGLLKDLRTLSKASTMCILFYTFFTCYVVVQSVPNIIQGDWYTKIRFWRVEGFFQCLPIFSFAFGCQTQLFIVYNALTEPSLKRINSIISAAVLLCMVAYLLVGFFGYIAFCNEKDLTGDIINHFNENNVSDAIKLCFVISIAVSIPLIVFPCRTSLYTLLFPQKPKEDVPGSGKIPEQHFQIITAAIIIGAMVTGILVPNVEFVLGLTGATMGTLICYIFPALFFIQVMSESSEGRLTSKIVLMAGLIVLIASTYTTLNTPDKLPEVVSLDNGLVDDHPADIAKIMNKREGPEEGIYKDLVKGDFEIKYKPPDSDGGLKRQEPPIPQAPLDTDKIAEKDVVSDKENKLDADNQNDGKDKDDAEVDIEQYKKENIKLREEKERLEEEEQKRKKEEEEKKEGEEKLKQEKEREEEEKRVEEEKKRIEAEKKQNQILNKLEQQQEEQEKLIQEQKEILQELKQHKDDHKDAAIDQNDPVLDQNAQKQQNEAVNQEFAKPVVEQQGQDKIPNQLVQGQPYIQGQLVGQNQLLNLKANVQQPLQKQQVIQNVQRTQQHVVNQQGIHNNIQNVDQNVFQNPDQNLDNNSGKNLGQNVVQNIGQNLLQNQGQVRNQVQMQNLEGQQPIQQKVQERVPQPLINQQIVGQKFNLQGQQVLQNNVLSNPQQGQKLVLEKQGDNQKYKGQLNNQEQVDAIQQNIIKNGEKALLNNDLDNMKHRGKRDIDDKTNLDEEGNHSEINKDMIEHKENVENDKERIQMKEDKLKKDAKEEYLENTKEEHKENIQKTHNSDSNKVVIESDIGEDNIKGENNAKQDNTIDNNEIKENKVLKDNSDNNGQRELKMVIDDKNDPHIDIKVDNVIDYVNEALKDVKDKLKYDNRERMNILDVQDARSMHKR